MGIILHTLGAGLFGTLLVKALEGYSAWKTDPDRVIVYRRNLLGRMVPDLTRKRITLALKAVLACLCLFGLAVDLTLDKNWFPPVNSHH